MRPVVLWMPGGVRTEVHLTSAQTGGALCLLIDEPPAGWRLPPHRHMREAETIHVLAGNFALDIDGERVALGAGDTAHVPVGTVHSGGNVGSETGRRVVIFSPAGVEGFFLEVGRAMPGEAPDGAEVAAAARRFGWDFVGRRTPLPGEAPSDEFSPRRRS
jgi:quercetin dioxygenase-like cupin family protein